MGQDEPECDGVHTLPIAIGFALPDFAPRVTGLYWLVAGIGGGLSGWWMGSLAARREGLVDREVGRRYGWHWGIVAIVFMLPALPMVVGGIDVANGASLFLLVAGLVYLLAGVHLDRGMVPAGVLMLVSCVFAIAVLLARHDEISFSRFKRQLKLSDGRLGAQLRRLEQDGYISLRRDFVARKPVTWYALTPMGRAALDKHLESLKALIAGAEAGGESAV